MIRIVDNWVIDSDGKTYTGGKLATHTLKDGTEEEYIKNPFYYNTLSGCIQAISRRMRAEGIKATDGDLKAAIIAIQSADERLMNAIESVFDMKIGNNTND